MPLKHLNSTSSTLKIKKYTYLDCRKGHPILHHSYIAMAGCMCHADSRDNECIDHNEHLAILIDI